MLENKVNEYLKLSSQIDDLNSKKEELKSEILKEFEDKKINEYTTESGDGVKLVKQTNFKYNDETAMIKWLETNGYTQFVCKSINTKSMNAELKKGQSLTESLKTMYTTSVTNKLNVVNKKA